MKIINSRALWCKALMVLCVGVLAFAGPGVAYASLSDDDVREINDATPGLDKVSLGTKLRGMLVTTSLDLPADYSSIPVTAHTVLYETSATNQAPSLADGYPGQILTIVFQTDGGGNIDITPDTKTGFTSITMDDAGEIVSLRFVDSTVGWTVVGSYGTLTITQ